MSATSTGAAPSPALLRPRLAVTTVFLVHGLYVAAWVPQIPTIKANLGLDEGRLSLALLMIAIGALAAMPLTGRLVTRFGSRAITLLGTVLMGIAFMLPVFMPSYTALLLWLLVAGMGIGMMDVAMNANGVEVEKHFDRSILSSLHGFYSVGGLVGSLAIATALRSGLSLEAVVAAGVSTCIAVGVLAGWFLFRTDARAEEPLTAAERAETAKPRRWRRPTGMILLLGIIGTLAYLTEGAVVDWGGVFSLGPIGADLADAGLAYAAFSAAMAITRLIGDRLQDRVGRRRLLVLGSALATAGFLGFTLAPNLPALMLASFVIGIGLANVVPIMFALAGRQPDTPSADGVAMVAALAYTGFLIGPPAIGWLATHTDLRMAFLAVTALALVMTVLALFAIKRRSQA